MKGRRGIWADALASIITRSPPPPCPRKNPSVCRATLSTCPGFRSSRESGSFSRLQAQGEGRSWQSLYDHTSPQYPPLSLALQGLNPEIVPSTFEENLGLSQFGDLHEYPVATANFKAVEVYRRLVVRC